MRQHRGTALLTVEPLNPCETYAPRWLQHAALPNLKDNPPPNGLEQFACMRVCLLLPERRYPMTDLKDFSSLFAQAADQLGSPAFGEALATSLASLVGADEVTLLAYGRDGPPAVVFATPPGPGETSTLDVYVTGPFLLDPFYRAAALDGSEGVFRLRDLAPGGFLDSEYYKTWYKRCGFRDECGLLIQLKQGFLNMAFGLTGGEAGSPAQFSKHQVALLEDCFPLVSALVRQHWDNLQPAATGETSFRGQLHASLTAFGTSVLTRREQQVIELVLLGHSTRLIAEKLQISVETVKLHRKHAYAKLDISSQAELFLLFMESLATADPGSQEDPLIAYHRKPSAAS